MYNHAILLSIEDVKQLLLTLQDGQTQMKSVLHKQEGKLDVISTSITELKEMIAKETKKTFSLKASELEVSPSRNADDCMYIYIYIILNYGIPTCRHRSAMKYLNCFVKH